MLELAAMVRSPANFKTFTHDLSLSLSGALLLALGAWMGNSVFMGFMATISLMCTFQQAADRRAQRQFKLILTVLRDLQSRCPKDSQAGPGKTLLP